MTDPSFLQSFSEDKWMSVHKLLHLGPLCFHIMSERLFTLLTFPALWGKAGVDFITSTDRKAMSTEITPLVVLVMDGVGEERLGMITTFYKSYQVRVEPSDALLPLIQQYSPELDVVLVKVFTNSPYLPWRSYGSPYWT